MPHSATGTRIRNISFLIQRVHSFTYKLTTVHLVSLVGAVWDAVTLWVDLADAGGGATLEVPSAIEGWST